MTTRVFSIRNLLIGIVVLLALPLLALAGGEAWLAWRVSAQAIAVAERNALSDKLIEAAAAWARERGQANAVLNAPEPATAAQLQAIEATRKAADAAFAAALGGLQRPEISFPDKQPLLATAEEQRKAFADLRRRVDAAAAKPREQREGETVAAWVPTITKMIEVSRDIRMAAELKSNSGEARLAALSDLKHFAWIMGEFAGRERALIAGAVASGQPMSAGLVDQIGQAHGSAMRAWVQIDAATRWHLADPELRRRAETVRAAYLEEITALRHSILKASEEGKPYPLTAQAWFEQASRAVNTMLAVGEAASQTSSALSAQVEAESDRQFAVSMAIVVVALALALTAVWLASIRIAGAISSMVRVMTGFAAGQMDTEIPSLDRKDEIGAMAKAVQVFKQGMVENLRLQEEAAETRRREEAAQREQEAREREAQEARRRQEEETRAAEEERKREAEEAQRQAEERARIEAEARRKREMNALADAFEASVKKVVQTVSAAATQLQSSSTALAATAEETTRQTSAVAAASEQASANVQTVAAASEELSSSISEIARQVSQSAQVARQATDRARATGATVDSLSVAAAKIGEVLNLISTIASQTNLLALNATIEAARAGEAGKGFAVVASEVKSLANQTARATDEIARQIGAVQGATQEAVVAIQEIGRTIEEISQISTTIASAVEEQTSATDEISRNVQEASTGTVEVSRNIGGVTESAAETGVSASEMKGAAEELSRQATTLSTEVDAFIAKVRAA